MSRWPRLPRNEVDEIYVGDEFDNETALRRVGERWLLPELENLPADAQMVDALLAAITRRRQQLASGRPVVRDNASGWRVTTIEDGRLLGDGEVL